MHTLIPLWTWGLVLDGTGLLGSWFLSNKNRGGWIISLVAQVLWTIYSVLTKQWGFFPGIMIQSGINIHGFKRWKVVGVEHQVASQELEAEAPSPEADEA